MESVDYIYKEQERSTKSIFSLVKFWKSFLKSFAVIDTTRENNIVIQPETENSTRNSASKNHADGVITNPTADSANESTAKWVHIQSELQSALNTWSDLTQKLANRVSPEEEQLQEVRKILHNIKAKLHEFEE